MEEDDFMQSFIISVEDDLLDNLQPLKNEHDSSTVPSVSAEFSPASTRVSRPNEHGNSQEELTFSEQNSGATVKGEKISDLSTASHRDDLQKNMQYLTSETKPSIDHNDGTRDSLLHCAIEKGKTGIVKLLLDCKTDMMLKNNNRKSFLDFATENNFQIFDSLTFSKINVPEDNSCLFWAISLAYLIPVKYDNSAFQERFERLFGTTSSAEIIKHTREIVRGYNPTSSSDDIFINKTMKNLVTERLRDKVLDTIVSQKSNIEQFMNLNEFIFTKNENFIRSGAFKEHFYFEFSNEINQYNVDISVFRPAVCNVSSLQLMKVEIDKIPQQEKVASFMLTCYLKCMRENMSSGGIIEIQAAGQMLCCDIHVSCEKAQRSFEFENSDAEILLFNNGEGHYSFCLVRASTLIEAVKEDQLHRVSIYLRFGIDDVNYEDRSGWTPLHYAAQRGHTEILKFLLEHGACSCVRSYDGQTPLDVARDSKKESSVIMLSRKCSREVCHRRADDSPKLNMQVSETTKQKELISSYVRSSGEGGYGGQLYEIQLVMFLILQGITKKEIGKINGFYLATNLNEAGDFDDAVFRYWYEDDKGVEKCKIIFLQAKLKTENADISEKDGKKKKQTNRKKLPENETQGNSNEQVEMFKEKSRITIEKLLSKSAKKGDFSLKDYFKSYQAVKKCFHEKAKDGESHPIFEGDFRNLDCDFVIYTNAAFPSYEKAKAVDDSTTDIKNVNGYYVRKTLLNQDDILYLEDMQNSNQYYQLILDGQKGQNIIDALQLSLPGEHLKTEEKWESNSTDKATDKIRVSDNEKKPTKDTEKADIKEFLEKVKLFFGQPNQNKLSEIVKQKIQSHYKVEKEDANLIFSDVRHKAERWWKGENYYITENNSFFEDSVKISIMFNIQKPVENFAGREKELTELHMMMKNNPGNLMVISQRSSAWDSGRMGKTQLARMYILQQSHVYDNNVIWINAENYKTLVESFFELARSKLKIDVKCTGENKMDINYVLQEVYKFFSKRKSLFVFDNAQKFETKDEGDAAIDKFMCSLSVDEKPRVLVTSRNHQWEKAEVLLLDKFTQAEALDFIRNELNLEYGEEEDEVELLSERLCGVPLALQQCVAHIKDENAKEQSFGEYFLIEHYLEKYEEEEMRLKQIPDFELLTNYQYNKVIFITSKIALTKIDYEIRAVDILDIITCFCSNRVSTKVYFKRIVDEELMQSCLQQSFVNNTNLSLELLEQYSQTCSEHEQAHIYRAVRHITEECREHQQRERKVLKKSLKLFQEITEEDKNAKTSTSPSAGEESRDISCEDLTNRLFSLLSNTAMKNDNADQNVNSYLFNNNICICDNIFDHVCSFSTQDGKQRKYDEALKAYIEVLTKSSVILKHDDDSDEESTEEDTVLGFPNTDDLKCTVSELVIFNSQERFDAELKSCQQVLCEVERILDTYHPDMFVKSRDLSTTPYVKVRHDLLFKSYEDVLGKSKMILEQDDDSDEENTEDDTVLGFRRQIKYDEALIGRLSSADKSNEVLSSDHGHLLMSKSYIEKELFQRGKYEDALKAYNEMLDNEKKLFEPNHHCILLTRYKIAEVLCALGKEEEALRIYQGVLEERKQLLKPDDPDILGPQVNIIRILHNKLLKVKKALNLLIPLLEQARQKMNTEKKKSPKNMAT